ncbi:hypothetical protein BK011_02310 [Tenericutes bacterium MZ-XQ]|nr:hypothetical protein BK011_02310 [Tenericutes bacterium MZ-XQ]
MSIHQQNKNKIDDALYTKGTLKYLVKDNPCVLLDGRRTPGIIEDIDMESGMFTWRILDFEDKGKCWELPFEDISQFQFLDDEKYSDKDVIRLYEDIIKQKKIELNIKIDIDTQKQTFKNITKIKEDIIAWMNKESKYFKSYDKLDWSMKKGSPLLSEDLKRYLDNEHLLYLEDETTSNFCLNPHSGELIKGMIICLAELGLVNYQGFEVRKKSTFTKPYEKETRKRYLMHRLAFVQAMFEKAHQKELTVYRGMTSEQTFKSFERPLISTTAHLESTKAFFDETIHPKHKSAYLLKLNMPVSQILMTYLETPAFSHQYLEQEVIILNKDGLPF